LVEIF
jgi:hypothetical protein